MIKLINQVLYLCNALQVDFFLVQKYNYFLILINFDYFNFNCDCRKFDGENLYTAMSKFNSEFLLYLSGNNKRLLNLFFNWLDEKRKFSFNILTFTMKIEFIFITSCNEFGNFAKSFKIVTKERRSMKYITNK